MRYPILSVMTELTGLKMRIPAAFFIAAFLKMTVSLNISYLVIYPYGPMCFSCKCNVWKILALALLRNSR